MSPQECWTRREGLRFAHRIIRHPEPRIRPTLFVSGAFQTMDSWARFAREFAPFTTVLLVDPPGMGASDLLPSHFGLDFLAGCLEQVLDEHGIERANIVAASYGTPAAYRLAQLHPTRVERVVLAGTMKQLPPHLLERISATIVMAREHDREALVWECVDGMLCQDPAKVIERRATAARVLRSSISRMSDAELAKYAENTERLLNHPPLDLATKVRGPEGLLFTGEHDVFSPPRDCREVGSGFERAWFTRIRRADHLFHLQRFDVVVELLLRFFRRELGPEPTDGWHEVEALRGRGRVAARVR